MAQNNHPLPAGFQLESYRIEKQLSHGGFSIVYLAHDAAGTPVAIKEYMPNAVPLRGEGQVAPVIPPNSRRNSITARSCFSKRGAR
jgi:serine/threonine protein kinase